MLNISRPRFARVIGSFGQNPYVGTLGVFLGAGIVTLNARLISVGLPDLRDHHSGETRVGDRGRCGGRSPRRDRRG